MTATSSSPRELLRAHILERRQAATVAGEPGDRSVFPGLGSEPVGFIFQDRKTLMFKPDGKKAEALTAARLGELLAASGESALVADADTFARMIAFAENDPKDQELRLARRLRLIRGLPRSTKLPLMTDVLSYRYWLPDTADEKRLESWGKAFGLKAPTTALTMRNLLPVALDGKRPERLRYDKETVALEKLETQIMTDALYSGISTDCSVYSMLEAYGSKEAGLRTIDPGLLNLHTIDGQVCRIRPLNVTAKAFTASVSSPFKLKEGDGLRLTDGDTLVNSDLTGVRYADGALSAEIANPSKQSGGALLVARAKAGSAKLYATGKVYDSRGTFLRNRRWMGGDVEPITGRDVPLDVVLAGGPVAA